MATTYDVLAFQINAPYYTQTLITNTNNGMLVTGKLKLAQRFVLELMTEQGSIPYQTNRGTTFVTQVKSGQFATEIDIFGAFSIALLDIKANLQNEESITDPADERYAGATLNTVTIQPQGIGLNITVQNLAGSSLGITVPISFNLNNN